MSKAQDLSNLNRYGPEKNVSTRMPITRLIEIRANNYRDPHSNRDYLQSSIDAALEMYSERRLKRAAPDMAAALEMIAADEHVMRAMSSSVADAFYNALAKARGLK